jgi:hypothetical protein
MVSIREFMGMTPIIFIFSTYTLWFFLSTARRRGEALFMFELLLYNGRRAVFCAAGTEQGALPARCGRKPCGARLYEISRGLTRGVAPKQRTRSALRRGGPLSRISWR